MDSFEMNPGYSILLSIISMFKRVSSYESRLIFILVHLKSERPL